LSHLYLEGAKVRGLSLADRDEPGFWEALGYHVRRPVAGAAAGRLEAADVALCDVAEVVEETLP
jgi:hypothetical protein